jgi:hypothetical protein
MAGRWAWGIAVGVLLFSVVPGRAFYGPTIRQNVDLADLRQSVPVVEAIATSWGVAGVAGEVTLDCTYQGDSLAIQSATYRYLLDEDALQDNPRGRSAIMYFFDREIVARPQNGGVAYWPDRRDDFWSDPIGNVLAFPFDVLVMMLQSSDSHGLEVHAVDLQVPWLQARDVWRLLHAVHATKPQRAGANGSVVLHYRASYYHGPQSKWTVWYGSEDPEGRYDLWVESRPGGVVEIGGPGPRATYWKVGKDGRPQRIQPPTVSDPLPKAKPSGRPHFILKNTG